MTYLDKWQVVADNFLSVVLVQPDAWIKALDMGVTLGDLPAGKWRDTWQAVIDLRSDKMRLPPDASRILLYTEVAAKAGAAVSVEYVAAKQDLYDEVLEEKFPDTCKLLLEYSAGHRQLAVMQQGQAKLKAALENGGGGGGEIIQGVMEDLRSESTVKQVGSVDIADLSEEEHQRMSEPQSNTVQTGVWLLDDWLRGITPGEFVAWIAAYKMRKTSVLANVMVNLARAKKRVLFCSYDESRSRVTHRIRALLMAEYMWNNGYWLLRTPDGAAVNVVDGKMIRNAGERWQQWPLPLRNAYQYARDVMATMRGYLRVYDQFTDLKGIPSIRAIALTEAMKGGEITLCAVDHIQRIPGFETTYQTVERGSGMLQELGNTTGMIMWVLSQMNEESIRNTTSANDYTPNAKGGGGMGSNPDTVLISKYKVGDITDPNYLHFTLKLAREGEFPLSGYVKIHPASGWITPERIEMKTIHLNAKEGANV